MEKIFEYIILDNRLSREKHVLHEVHVKKQNKNCWYIYFLAKDQFMWPMKSEKTVYGKKYNIRLKFDPIANRLNDCFDDNDRFYFIDEDKFWEVLFFKPYNKIPVFKKQMKIGLLSVWGEAKIIHATTIKNEPNKYKLYLLSPFNLKADKDRKIKDSVYNTTCIFDTMSLKFIYDNKSYDNIYGCIDSSPIKEWK